MRNSADWKPSKFIQSKTGWMASSDPTEVSISSRLITNRVAEEYYRFISQHAFGNLADLGCGKVPLYGMYKDLVSDVTCIDWKNSSHSSPYLDFEADLNNEIPLPDEIYDTIIASDVLEHLYAPDIFWSEMSRLLKHSGKIILGVPFFYWLHETPHDYFRYTRFRLQMYCYQYNLEIIELSEYGGPLSVVLDIIGKNIYRSKLSELFQRLSLFFYNTTLCRRLDAKNKKLFPLGYVLVAQKK